MNKFKKPYLSFVVVGRNDNYGHRFLYRTQNFLDNVAYLCEKYKLDSELIFIEWNPPKNNKRMYEALNINKNRKYLKIRFIGVPNKLHRTLQNSDKCPIYEYLGKNVGIRRSNGDFVLITNPDILFNEELIRFFSKRKLKESYFYRIARYDLLADIPENLTTKEKIQFCKINYDGIGGVFFWADNPRKIISFLKKLPRRIIFNVKRILGVSLAYRRYSYVIYQGGAPGDFILISRRGWFKFRGFPEIFSRGGLDGYGCVIARSSGLKMKTFRQKNKIYHQSHGKPHDNLRRNFDNASRNAS